MNITNINPYLGNKYYEPKYRPKKKTLEKGKTDKIKCDTVEISADARILYKKLKTEE